MFSHKKKTKQIISALFLWVLQYFVRLINLNLNLKLSIQNKYENKNKLYSNTNFNFFNQFIFLIFWQMTIFLITIESTSTNLEILYPIPFLDPIVFNELYKKY